MGSPNFGQHQQHFLHQQQQQQQQQYLTEAECNSFCVAAAPHPAAVSEGYACARRAAGAHSARNNASQLQQQLFVDQQRAQEQAWARERQEKAAQEAAVKRERDEALRAGHHQQRELRAQIAALEEQRQGLVFKQVQQLQQQQWEYEQQTRHAQLHAQAQAAAIAAADAEARAEMSELASEVERRRQHIAMLQHSVAHNARGQSDHSRAAPAQQSVLVQPATAHAYGPLPAPVAAATTAPPAPDTASEPVSACPPPAASGAGARRVRQRGVGLLRTPVHAGSARRGSAAEDTCSDHAPAAQPAPIHRQRQTQQQQVDLTYQRPQRSERAPVAWTVDLAAGHDAALTGAGAAPDADADADASAGTGVETGANSGSDASAEADIAAATENLKQLARDLQVQGRGRVWQQSVPPTPAPPADSYTHAHAAPTSGPAFARVNVLPVLQMPYQSPAPAAAPAQQAYAPMHFAAVAAPAPPDLVSPSGFAVAPRPGTPVAHAHVPTAADPAPAAVPAFRATGSSAGFDVLAFLDEADAFIGGANSQAF
jgi:hypothetical protein